MKWWLQTVELRILSLVRSSLPMAANRGVESESESESPRVVVRARSRSRSRRGARSASRSRNSTTTTPKFWQGSRVGVGLGVGREPGVGVGVGVGATTTPNPGCKPLVASLPAQDLGGYVFSLQYLITAITYTKKLCLSHGSNDCYIRTLGKTFPLS